MKGDFEGFELSAKMSPPMEGFSSRGESFSRAGAAARLLFSGPGTATALAGFWTTGGRVSVARAAAGGGREFFKSDCLAGAVMVGTSLSPCDGAGAVAGVGFTEAAGAGAVAGAGFTEAAGAGAVAGVGFTEVAGAGAVDEAGFTEAAGAGAVAGVGFTETAGADACLAEVAGLFGDVAVCAFFRRATSPEITF